MQSPCPDHTQLKLVPPTYLGKLNLLAAMICSLHGDGPSAHDLQNEFTTEGGKLHDAVKGVMER